MTDRDETARLLELTERVPKHVLFRHIRKSSDITALCELQKISLRKMQSGLQALWGQLSYEEIGSLASRCQARVDQLQARAARESQRLRTQIQQKPYLAPSMKEFDPHVTKTKENQPTRRPASGKSPRRKRRRGAQ